MPPTVLHSPGPHESIAPNSDSKFEREHAFPWGQKSKSASKSVFPFEFRLEIFESEFGAIDLWGPGECNTVGGIISKKLRKLFLRFLITW